MAKSQPIRERDWQRTVTDYAELMGFSWAHFRAARTKHGWRTPVEGPLGRGFPDLVLTRERVVFVELKGSRGKPSAIQVAVHASLRQAGAEIYCWGPDDWPEVEATLGRREQAAGLLISGPHGQRIRRWGDVEHPNGRCGREECCP